MEEDNGAKDDINYRPLVILFIVVFITWVISIIVVLSWIKGWDARGNFGDSFGAINALFSGFAFAGIIYTILLQKKELTLQRKELEDTRTELRRAADAQERSERAFQKQIEMMNLSARLNALNSAVEYYNSKASARLAKGNKVGASVYDSKANELLKEIDMILEQLRNFDTSTAPAADPALKKPAAAVVGERD